MASSDGRGGRGATDDETIALVLQLHREPDINGTRRSSRDISADCRRLGKPVSHKKVAEIISEAHAETIGAATSQIREKIADALDINVARIQEMSELLANVARTGRLPGNPRVDAEGTEQLASAAQVVAAAREAINGSVQLLSAVGVSGNGDMTSEEAAARIRGIYGLDDSDEEPGNGPASPVPETLAH